jgi:hypothetical protein
MDGSPCPPLAHLIFLPRANIIVSFKQDPPPGAIFAGGHLGMVAQVGVITPTMSSMSYRIGAGHYPLMLCVTHIKVPHTAHLLALARDDTTLWTALAMIAVLPPGKHGAITLHIQSQLSPLLQHMSQSPQACAPVAAVLLLIGVSSCRSRPCMTRSVSPHAYPRENRRLILKSLPPPL